MESTTEKEQISNLDLYKEIVACRNELKSSFHALETRLLLTVEELKYKIHKLEETSSFIENKLERFDRNLRKNNIIVFGLKPVEVTDIAEYTLRELRGHLGIDIQKSDLKNLYTVGKSENKPILIEFLSYFKKLEVLRNCNRLKGTSIRIAQDLTPEQRGEEQILRKHLKLARLEKNNRCMIKGLKLIVNGTSYSASDLENQEQLALEKGNRKLSSAPETPEGGGTLRFGLGTEREDLHLSQIAPVETRDNVNDLLSSQAIQSEVSGVVINSTDNEKGTLPLLQTAYNSTASTSKEVNAVNKQTPIGVLSTTLAKTESLRQPAKPTDLVSKQTKKQATPVTLRPRTDRKK